MLTIDDIKNVSFRKAGLGGGYNADDVDSFVDEGSFFEGNVR